MTDEELSIAIWTLWHKSPFELKKPLLNLIREDLHRLELEKIGAHIE
jgi:hypothetical protein